MAKNIDPQHTQKRQALRSLGFILLIVGGIFIAVGLVDFFSAFGSFGARPKYFWCLFVGMPVAAVGGALLQFGFMGTVARYSAGEMSPVAKDTFNYMADGTKDGIRTVATAVGEGLKGVASTPTQETSVRCPKCNYLNSETAKFCSECGDALQKTKACPQCGELNDTDARFCDNCGTGLG